MTRAALAPLFVLLNIACAHGPAPAPAPATGTLHGHGTFDVKIVPIATAAGADKPLFAGLLFDKQFHGDLDGVSTGQMTAWGTGEKSGAYVALEQVTGSLCGRHGSFVLAHKGEMTAESGPVMLITVAPGSGTDELVGLSGTMVIHIVDGKHSWDLDYSLPGGR